MGARAHITHTHTHTHTHAHTHTCTHMHTHQLRGKKDDKKQMERKARFSTEDRMKKAAKAMVRQAQHDFQASMVAGPKTKKRRKGK
jgi:hypothetical protein